MPPLILSASLWEQHTARASPRPKGLFKMQVPPVLIPWPAVLLYLKYPFQAHCIFTMVIILTVVFRIFTRLKV